LDLVVRVHHRRVVQAVLEPETLLVHLPAVGAEEVVPVVELGPPVGARWRGHLEGARETVRVGHGTSRSGAGRWSGARGTGGTASHAAPPVPRPIRRGLAASSRRRISPVTLLSTNRSGVTAPDTSASPSPHTPSTTMDDRSPVTGLSVISTPAASASTIRWT